MSNKKLFSLIFLLLNTVFGCASPITIAATPPSPKNPTSNPVIESSQTPEIGIVPSHIEATAHSSAYNDLPVWVGTPAVGEPPKSTHQLKYELANGDILYDGGLLWFLWENTKSRIWFPGIAPDDYTIIKNAKLEVSATTMPKPEEGIILVTEDKDGNGISNVFWGDPNKKILYPLTFKDVLVADLLPEIPTCYGIQYYPSVSINQ